MASVVRVLILVLAVTGAVAAPTAAELNALLAQLPATATLSRDSVMPALVKMGPEVVAALASRLVEPGKGDDNGARWALHGLALWVSRPGSGPEREWYVRAVKAELAKTTWSEFNRQFLDEQVRWAGVEATPGVSADAETPRSVPTAAEVKALEKAAVSATGFDRWERTDELLNAARRLAEGKQAARAVSIYRGLLKARKAETHVRCAALRGLALAEGAKACPDLLAGLTAAEPDVAACAGWIATSTPGADVTKWWAARVSDRTLPAGSRTAVLGIVAARGDASVLPKVRAALKDRDAGVRGAALRAVAALAKEAAVSDLVKGLGRGEAPVAAVARECLLGLPGTAGAAIEAAVAGAPAPVRAALLGILGARGAASSLAVALRHLADPDLEVRKAVLGAVGVLGGPDNLAGIVDRVIADADSRDAAADAFGLITKRMKDKAPAAKVLLDPLPKADSGARAALVGLLPRAGGEAALAAVREGLASPDAAVREASVRALGNWPDASPLEDLSHLARSAPETVFRVLALRGYVRLAADADEGDAVLVRRLCEAYGIAGRTEDRTLVLSAMAKVAHPAALAFTLSATADQAVRQEAAAAAGRIAGELVLTRREEARSALEIVLKVSTSEDVKKAAKESMEAIEACEDYVTAWEIAGPYMVDGLEKEKLLDTTFPPERPDATDIHWRLMPRNEEQEEPYILDLKYALEGDNRAGYLRTRVFVLRKMKATLEVGSDDAVKVWIGGSVVHANNDFRGLKCGEDKAEVKLAKGWNAVLVKVVNGEGDWTACVRFRTADGGPIPGLRAETGEEAP